MDDSHIAHLHGGPMHGQQIALAEVPTAGIISIMGLDRATCEFRQARYTAVRGQPGDYEWSGFQIRDDIET